MQLEILDVMLLVDLRQAFLLFRSQILVLGKKGMREKMRIKLIEWIEFSTCWS
jgi:hypothetical protein